MKDFIGYQALTDAALRGVVRDALKRVEKQGLIGSHHFCVTFKTEFPGVEIPDFLREQYPEEMMIILQHQFSGLKVKDDHFRVTLSFKKIPATLVVPFCALTQFADPGVQFALQFQESGEPVRGKKSPTPLTTAKPEALPAAAKPAAAETPPDAEKPAAPAEVVSLDAFRKK
ncbi:MAG TPA: ClpXP protease specificity-enhancing factor SspB [Rhizomicrobium sp.]|nr:ClpXP protease specificity-enhancing factor SspB [Rhizomicrobium sp.]